MQVIEQLRKVQVDLHSLSKLRANLNIVNNAVVENEQMEAIFRHAISHVGLCIQFNEQKLLNSPTYKLTIEQS